MGGKKPMVRALVVLDSRVKIQFEFVVFNLLLP